ncbi:MAG: polysaccharide export protein [Prevotella sp.]|nr:polysaccharide export protein [Prevotella sp.]
MKKKLFMAAIACVLLAGCKTQREVTYFQDLNVNSPQLIDSIGTVRMEPDDQISILVSCKEPEIAALFNLVRSQQRVGTQGSGLNSNGETSAYTIDSEGNIDFPVLGKLHVAGLTKQEVATLVKQRLVESDQVKNPVVTVEFANLAFSVLGEVKNAGKYPITRNRTTLLDAISMAGDLTITGLRDSVYVVREEGGKRVAYSVDLRSKDVFTSPVYYVKQNDVIYVRPNAMRAGQSTINENTFSSVGFWMSLGSFLMSLGVLVFK